MIQVFSKKYENKFTSEVTYFFSIQNHGTRPFLQTVYENISDYGYYFSRYTIELNFYPRHKDKIEVEVLTYSPHIITKIKSKRKLAIFTKFVFHIIMMHNDVNITKSINKVMYHNNGQEITLSPNSFLKSYYGLVPYFYKIIQESKPI
jgi:hypothetical protein